MEPIELLSLEDKFLENQFVVITVPASFDEGARDLTMEAVREVMKEHSKTAVSFQNIENLFKQTKSAAQKSKLANDFALSPLVFLSVQYFCSGIDGLDFICRV